MLRHFTTELQLRKDRKASAKERAEQNKEIFKIKSLLLENAFTPSEIANFLSDEGNINILKQTIRKEQNQRVETRQTGGTN